MYGYYIYTKVVIASMHVNATSQLPESYKMRLKFIKLINGINLLQVRFYCTGINS